MAKAATVLKTGGKWNTYEITARGPKFTVILNGVKTVDGAEDGKFKEGRIALQYGQGTVKFRKVLIKPLVNLIWLAGFVFLAGSLVALWPDAREQRRLVARLALARG